MASEWYRKLDVHAPLAEMLPMLAKDGLKMNFPEATLHGPAAFKRWYKGVCRIFFDEVHRIKSLKAAIGGNKARVKIVVRWEASRWRPPAAYSERIVCHAYQTWHVQLDERSGKPVVVTYIVNRLKYVRGSTKL
jgi:hypothetical protein